MRQVRITLVGQAGEVSEFDELLLEWFGRERFQVFLGRQPSLEAGEIIDPSLTDRAVRIWVVLPSRQLARIYFADASERRFLVRLVPLRNGLDELGREQVVQILLASAEAFVAHRASSTVAQVVETFGPSRSVVVRRAPGVSSRRPLVAVGSREPGWHPEVGLFYTARLQGLQEVSHGPGLVIGIDHAAHPLRWLISGRGEYRWPTEFEGSSVSVSTQTTALTVSLGVESPIGRGFGAGIELGTGAEHVVFVPRVRSDPAITARPRGSHWSPSALIALRGSIRSRAFDLTALAGVRMGIEKTHYDVDLGGRRQREVTPWLIQPGTTLGLSWGNGW